MVRLVLHAGSGAATAVGGGGTDIFYAGTGTGDFTGGAGKDIFVFNARDGHAVIEDFTSGADHLKFTGLTKRRHPHQGGDRGRRLRPAGHLRHGRRQRLPGACHEAGGGDMLFA